MEKAFLGDRSRDPGEMSGGRVEDGPETSTLKTASGKKGNSARTWLLA